jgi:hypothetical protein
VHLLIAGRNFHFCRDHHVSFALVSYFCFCLCFMLPIMFPRYRLSTSFYPSTLAAAGITKTNVYLH